MWKQLRSFLPNPTPTSGVNLALSDSNAPIVFAWLTRVGAGPHLRTMPMDRYQRHQTAAVNVLEDAGRQVGIENPERVRLRNGQFEVLDSTMGRWVKIGMTPSDVFEDAAIRARA